MKRLPKENEYQLDIKDQFKNEFEIGQLQGNNFHMTDSADLPMLIEPQGNIEQEVIEAVEGIVVEGSSINVNDVDTSYEDSIMPQGNIEQVVVEEIPGNTIEGEIINITNGDSTKEVKAIVHGNSYQETIAEEVGTTIVNKSIHLTDVNAAKESKLTPNGGIEQGTREGYNLVNVEDYTDTSGFITSINSEKFTATSKVGLAYEQVFYFNNVKLKTGVTYTLRRIMKIISGTLLTRTGMFELYLGNTWIKVIGRTNPNGYDARDTFTVDEDGIYRVRIILAASNDVTTPFTVEFSNLMIYEGTDVKPYEQYGSMPSLDFPSEVKGVGSEENINLLNLKNGSFSGNTDSVLTVENGKCNTVVGSSATANFGIGVELNEPFKLLAGQEYTLINGLGTAYPYIGLRKYKSTGTSIVSTAYDDNGLKVFTVDEDVEVGQMYAYHNYGNSNINFYPMLLKGRYTKADLPSFTPYGYCRYDTVVENKSLLRLTPKYINYNVNSDNFGVSNGYATTQKILVHDNKKIYYCLLEDFVTTSDKNIRIGFFKEDGTFISRHLHSIGKQMMEIDIPSETNYIMLAGSYGSANSLWVEIDKVYVGFSNIPIEHQEQLLPIDIPTGTVLYSGKPYKENGKWFRPIEYKKEYLSGKLNSRVPTSNSSKYSISFNLDNARRGTSTELYTGFSNILKATTIDNIYNHFTEGIAYPIKTNDYYGTGGVFYLEETSQMTLEQANAYITEKGMYVVYPLATPTIEEITDTTLIAQLETFNTAELYDGVTNINTYSSSENVANLPIEAHYNFITPSPSVERPSDIEVIDTVNKINMPAKTKTKNGLTLTIFEDNTFKVTGTPTANKATEFVLAKNIDFTPYFGKQMTLDCGFVVPTGNQGAIITSVSNNEGNRIYSNFWNIDNNNSYGYTTKTFQASNYDISNGFLLEFSLYFNALATPSEVNIEGYLQLNEGGRKPYLPYGHIGLKQRGKNYFKLKEDFEQNGVKLTKLENGYFKVEGKPTANGNFILTENMYLQNQNNFSLEFLEGAFPSVWFWNNTDSKTVVTLNKTNNSRNYNSDGLKSIICAITLTKDTQISFVARVQIEQGDTKTKYESYIEPIVHPINLNGNTLAKVGDIKDLLNIGLDGSVRIDKKTNESVLTGNEDWLYNSDFKVFFSRAVIGCRDGASCLSNYFKGAKKNYQQLKDGEICTNMSSGNQNNNWVLLRCDKFATIDELNAWLKEKYASDTPMKVLYELLKADIINLPSIAPIKLFEGTNNFELVTNLDTTINMTYNHVGYSPSIVKPSEVKGVGSDKTINYLDMLDIFGGSNISVTNSTNESVDVETADYTKDATIYFKAKNLKAGVTYKASVLVEVLSGTIGKSFGRIELYDGYTWIKAFGYYSESTNSTSGTFTVDKDGTYNIRLLVSASSDNLAQSLKIKLKEFMVYDYTNKENKLFTPYGYCRYHNKVKNKNILELPEFTQTQNGVTLTYNKGVVTLKGTTIKDKTYFFYNHKVATAEAGKTYYFDRDRTNLDSHIQIFLGKNIGAFGTEPTFMTNVSKKAITTDGDLYLLIYMQQGIGAGTNIDVTFQPQLAISEVATEIVDNQTQTLPIDIPINKEIFDKENAPYVNGFISSAGKITSASTVKTYYLKCEKNTTYTFKKLAGKYFRVNETSTIPKTEDTCSGTTKVNDTGTEITITTSNIAEYVVFNVYDNSQDTVTEQEILDSLSIKEQNIWYSGKPYKVNGKWYRDVEWKKKVFNGAENWIYYEPTKVFYDYDIIPDSKKDSNYPYCNYLKGGGYGNKSGTIMINNIQRVHISLWDFTTVAELKSWLQELYANGTPLYMVYELAEPYPEEITDAHLIEQLEALQNAEFYDGVTNINSYRSSEDVAEMPLEAHYNFITPSPSIDRPSEVLEVGSEEDINLYNIGDVEETTKNGITYSIKNGRFKANGTATQSFTIATTNVKFDLESGVYTLGSKVISGTYSGIVGKYVTKAEATVIDGNLIDAVGRKKLTEKATSVYASIYVNNGVVFNNYEADLMLVKGEYTKDTLPPFTPYGYCRYENIISNINLVDELKNISTQIGGLTTTEKNGKMVVNGTPTNDYVVIKAVNITDLLEDGVRYTLIRYGESGIHNQCNIKKIDGTSIYVHTTEFKTASFIFNKATMSKVIYQIQSGTVANTGTLVNHECNFMIVKGNYVGVIIDYTPHQEQSLPIDLPIGMKMYNDEFFYKENGKWWRNIKYVKSKLTSDMEWYLEVFDGIGRPRTDDFANIIKNVSAVNTVRVYSNYFKQNYGKVDYVFGNLKVGYLGFYTNKQLYLTTYFKNVNDWKTYLDENDVYIVFEIEPYPEEITDANLIAQLEKTLTPFSYYPVTNINSYRPTTNVADLKLYAEYFKSNKITNK